LSGGNYENTFDHSICFLNFHNDDKYQSSYSNTESQDLNILQGQLFTPTRMTKYTFICESFADNTKYSMN